jgi:hypothetical protein
LVLAIVGVGDRQAAAAAIAAAKRTKRFLRKFIVDIS